MGTKDKLSYDRLISRVEYYKEKALDLEKKLVFAEETIEKLEMNNSLQVIEKQEEEIIQLRKQVEELTKKLNRLDVQEMEKRLQSYEDLLKTIQDELNDKDQQIDQYQQRIKSMEKRLNINRTSEPVIEGSESSSNTKESRILEGTSCISYFDYSVILTKDKTGFVRGSFYIENTGTDALDNPYICFRFQPAESAALKGKIVSLISGPTQDELTQFTWMFMDNEWAEQAKDRGEIWVCPLRETKLSSGERLSLNDFQIPIKSKIDNNIMVEAFVYFHKQNYNAKAVNHIAINF
ncbi:hypothetical protein ABE41_008730 [Fictibacillus arsenicus]|uniref:Uncharacterized protein n=1 Tax=Fictibacillus arsenicus TaxID=255247 RepID=A0A1B1Z3U2_9BACL|nr:hypothetical protein [Fictibacillus arsenicus]ANX12090.1 hypothetical protein ABE41_008730 [Fictibacillus arsenicus]